jgi:hypothetical protein
MTTTERTPEPELPPRDFPPYDYAVTRSYGALRSWEGYVFRWAGSEWKFTGHVERWRREYDAANEEPT